MRRGFLLGVLGGIFSFVMGIFAAFVMLVSLANGVEADLWVSIVLSFIAGVLGIIGSVMGNKKGGVTLIFSAILALIATSVFGIPPFILLVLGGILTYRERGIPEVEPVTTKRNILTYIVIVTCAVGILSMSFGGLNVFHIYFLQPRAKLTASIYSFEVASFDSTWSSMSVDVSIANNSPRTANIIKDWNLTLVFSNSKFQFPIQNCTYGTTKLEPAQQTEFVFSYDITNNTSIDTNALRSMIFIISYIDDQGTQTQQFESIRPHS